LDSLFLDLDDLLGSFARERTLCLKPFMLGNRSECASGLLRELA
jgi:hypothetical protein